MFFNPLERWVPLLVPEAKNSEKNRNDVFFAGNDIYEVKFAAEFKNPIYFVIQPLMTSLWRHKCEKSNSLF